MSCLIRPLQAHEVTPADQLFRLAFGTFVGLPQPTDFAGDANYIQHRWKADPTTAYAAEVDGKLVGSNFAIHWGSVGFFGPLTVHPECWGQGIAQKLIEPVVDRLTQSGVTLAGLFTFPNSAKHHALYQKFGFYPRFLTFIMAKALQPSTQAFEEETFSQLNQEGRSSLLKACSELTDAIYSGLDVSNEILIVQTQNLGDTVLLWNDNELVGFAVCHCGAGSEAGRNTCYVKFAAVRPGLQAGEQFEQLLGLCEAFGASQGMSRLLAGVNTSRDQAYTRMIACHYRSEIIGVVMHRPNEPGYDRSDVFVLDDWR